MLRMLCYEGIHILQNVYKLSYQRCNEAINQFHRLPDNAKFYSCDLDTCSKYFENELDYQNHVKLHDVMNTVKWLSKKKTTN